MLGYIKGLLKIDDIDQDDEEALQNDINKYTSIIYSSKYADSNSNTEALEKLVAAMNNLDTGNNDSPALDTNNVSRNENLKQQNQINTGRSEQADVPDKTEEPTKFRELLHTHLKLLEELQSEDSSILPGEPPYKPKKFGRDGNNKSYLKKFDVPNYIYQAMDANHPAILGLNYTLDHLNYSKRFQTLLWVEEAHQCIEMRRYDQHNSMLAKYDGTLFLLHVPGLAEGRPSLMRGDIAILQSDKRSTKYSSYIFEVREKDIIIKLHDSLYHSDTDGLRFDVSFIQSRTPFRRCHYGVTKISECNDLLLDIAFPVPLSQDELGQPKVETKESQSDDLSKLRCFNTCLNEYQRQAVVNVLKGECRPAPYIVFGPPGTGKTVTMVEAVLQVYARKRACKILVCGNSNACVDLIARRIQNSEVVPKSHIIRVSAFHRVEKELTPPDLVEITKDMDSIDNSSYYNSHIIVTTCSQSFALNEFDTLFDYVFVDEAGHATEPEVMISINLCKRDGCIVLAGDPHQLGPVCISHLASQSGLGTSLLERLSGRSVYQRRVINSKMAYDDRYVTKLRISYRSDKRVMVVNNELFYHNELLFKNSTPKRWLNLLNVKNPLIFHCVKGRERREYTNPSWFNPNEAIVVLSYVNRLFNAGLRAEQLGVITPYKRQIEKLNLLFDSCGMRRCKIATMEEFQGDEREIIIISTVRTREKNLAIDKRFNLGFLFNPKRFNVAISRAKWMVIVVGDREILSRDSCWRKYLEIAHIIEEKPEEKKTNAQVLEK